jgi:TetR/AcrR family transcriptional regulator, ethionamide resistance regulator
MDRDEGSASRGVWRRPSKGEARRADILAALEGLLIQRRLAEISVDDVARAAGVRRTAFYFYFPNKSTAVAALLSEGFDAMVAGAADFFERRSGREESVRAALAEVWTWWRKRASLMTAMRDARESDHEVRELWEQWLERFTEPVAEVIEAERRDGRAPGGPDAHELVRLLVAMNVTALERLPGCEDDEADRAFEAVVAVWTRTLYTDSTRVDNY